MKKGRMLLQAGWYVSDIWVPWATPAAACISVLPPSRRMRRRRRDMISYTAVRWSACMPARAREGGHWTPRPQRSTMFAHG